MEVNLTNAEQIIMKTIWNANSPISAIEIQEKNKDKNWKIQTVNTLLQRMLKKEVIQYEKKQINKTQAYYYTASISEKEFIAKKSNDFLSIFHDNSIQSFLSSLTNSNKISKKDLKETKKWLQSLEKEMDD